MFNFSLTIDPRFFDYKCEKFRNKSNWKIYKRNLKLVYKYTYNS